MRLFSSFQVLFLVLILAECCAQCVDDHPDCLLWAKHGECDNNPAYMKQKCKKSCQTCPAPVPDKCVDCLKHPPTDCHLFTNYMTKYCGSCGVCDSNACENFHTSCDEWAKRDECAKNPKYMEVWCRKACLICKPTTGNERCDNCKKWVNTPGNCYEFKKHMQNVCNGCPDACPGACRNESPLATYCGIWEKAGECKSNPAYMNYQCALSCSTC